jgi:hypothetical protein
MSGWLFILSSVLLLLRLPHLLFAFDFFVGTDTVEEGCEDVAAG